ncbi:MAG TPA: DUF4296 domain-containing protein [Crocinitomix sp.]|nr:DUF4296 domain-containing protein [Crocinitomix sp.]
MKYTFVVIFFLLSFSCSNSQKSTETPPVLLEREELIDLIVDIQLLESHYHTLYKRPEIYANALDSASFYIFKKHNTTKEIYKSNILYWTKQPDTLYHIYEAALDTVNNRINLK